MSYPDSRPTQLKVRVAKLLLRPFSAMEVVSGLILTLAVLKLWMLLTMLSLHEYLRIEDDCRASGP